MGVMGAALLHFALGMSMSGWTRDYSAHSDRLRSDKLEDYDKVSVPTSDRSNSSAAGGSLAGTDVGVRITFYSVESTDITMGRMRIKVWMSWEWTDERLAWDPADYGNVTTAYYLGVAHSAPEDTEIWVPDITLYNSGEGIPATFEGQLATVASNGLVCECNRRFQPAPRRRPERPGSPEDAWQVGRPEAPWQLSWQRVRLPSCSDWSRPGVMDVLCKFSGLVGFPFDTLRCKFELGGWILSGWQQGIHLKAPSIVHAEDATGAGWVMEGKQATAGQAYTQHFIQSVEAKVRSGQLIPSDSF